MPQMMPSKKSGLRRLDEDVGGGEVAVDDVVLVKQGNSFPDLGRQGLQDGRVVGGLAVVPQLFDEVATRFGIFQELENENASVNVREVDRRRPDADQLAPGTGGTFFMAGQFAAVAQDL